MFTGSKTREVLQSCGWSLPLCPQHQPLDQQAGHCHTCVVPAGSARSPSWCLGRATQPRGRPGSAGSCGIMGPQLPNTHSAVRGITPPPTVPHHHPNHTSLVPVLPKGMLLGPRVTCSALLTQWGNSFPGGNLHSSSVSFALRGAEGTEEPQPHRAHPGFWRTQNSLFLEQELIPGTQNPVTAPAPSGDNGAEPFSEGNKHCSSASSKKSGLKSSQRGGKHSQDVSWQQKNPWARAALDPAMCPNGCC